MGQVFEIAFHGLLIGILISAPMGPIGVLVIQRTLNKGRKPALYTGCGAALSDLTYCLLTGLGLSFVHDFVVRNQAVLQIIGSLFIIAYALFLFRKNPSRQLKTPKIQPTTYWRDFVTGFLFTFSNPLILFFIIGLFARFEFLDAHYHALEYVAGYLSIAAGALGWWFFVTYFVNKVRAHFNLRSMWVINRVIGTIILIMAAVGLWLGIKSYYFPPMDNSTAKTLSIPYIKELDTMTADEVIKALDDRGARRTIDTVNWPDQFPYSPLTTFSVAHSDTAIYIDFFVRCNYLRAVNYANNSPVHQDSCVEFFVQPDLNDPHYYNFEFNCIGTIDAARRLDRHNVERLTDAQLDSVKRTPSCGNRPFEEVEGMFNWNLLVSIPLDLIGLKYEGKPLKVRGNFYKCADMTSVPHFLTWSPVTTPQPDFHRPEFFGDLTLE